MMDKKTNVRLWLSARGLIMPTVVQGQVNHAAGRPVSVSSVYQNYAGSNGVDTVLSDASRWLGAAFSRGNVFEVELAGPAMLRQAHMYSGYGTQSGSGIDSISFEGRVSGEWQTISGSEAADDNEFITVYHFDPSVTADRVRLIVNDTGVCRLWDLALWSEPTSAYVGMTGDNRPVWIEQGYYNHAFAKLADDRCLLVRDLTVFTNRFGSGLPVVGAYSGDLSDTGETLLLGDINGNTLTSLDYSDPAMLTDYSMVYPENGTVRSSAYEGGSPGATDTVLLALDPEGDTDGDSVDNLMHHAVTGLDKAYFRPQVQSLLVGEGGPLVEYPSVRHLRDLRADDSLISVDWSSNLTVWSSAVFEPSETQLNNDGTALWYWRATEPWDAHSALFFKLNVQYDPDVTGE